MYTSYDVACETALTTVEPCLDKGDMLFVIDTTNLAYSQNFTLMAPSGTENVYPPTYTADSGDLYTITKIYKQDPTAVTFQSTGHEAAVLPWATLIPCVGPINFRKDTARFLSIISLDIGRIEILFRL